MLSYSWAPYEWNWCGNSPAKTFSLPLGFIHEKEMSWNNFFSFAIVFPRVKPNKRQTHFLGAKKSFLQNNFFLQIEVKTLCVCVLQRPLQAVSRDRESTSIWACSLTDRLCIACLRQKVCWNNGFLFVVCSLWLKQKSQWNVFTSVGDHFLLLTMQIGKVKLLKFN